MLTSFHIGLLTLLASCITIAADSNDNRTACYDKCDPDDQKPRFAQFSQLLSCLMECDSQYDAAQRIILRNEFLQALKLVTTNVAKLHTNDIQVVKSNVEKLHATTPAPDYTVQEILPISSVSISGAGLLLSLVFVIATCRRLKRQQTGSYRLHLYKKPAEQETTFSV